VTVTPRATYRVQIRPDFGFADTAALAGYLARLGVTHLYSPPILTATPGSAHGYDVVDHRMANPQLGGEEGRLALVAALREHGLGLVVDIVPNHMGVAVPAANPAWWDVLRLGRESPYAHWFDVDWSRGPIVLPVLSDDLPEADELARLVVKDDELHYYEHRYPIAPGTGGGTPEEVHARQHYRLVCWRRGNTELNYRRFFAVSDLAGLRVEDPSVFEATHREVLRWVAAGEVDGIRVDHPDGLRDPGEYLARLRAAAPDAWLVVEKILEHGERLPAEPAWPVAGTTGYDALDLIDRLFVDPAGEPALTTLDTELSGAPTDYAELIHDCKLDVATGMFRTELTRLVRLVESLPGDEVRTAIAELVAGFPVYRSYLPDGAHHLTAAASEARRRRPDLASTVDYLLPRLADPTDELALRFQQYTGAVMAKGVEDTAFYRWTRLLSRNEVGADPSVVSVPVDEFHAECAERQATHPDGMTTLSTHDTKRGEDVRARLAVLAELPAEWAATVRELAAAAPLPAGSIQQLVWQTVIGAWPIPAERLHAVLEKSAREARLLTSWDEPVGCFEAVLHATIDQIFADPALGELVRAFAGRITPYGWSNSLSAKLVQLTMPGVPDVYQGCELWDNSLVDPDNRRPVDFDARRELLDRLDDGFLPAIDASGAAKLLVVSRALRLRRDDPERFRSYAPLPVTGEATGHAVAYDRGGAVTIATRLPVGLDRRGGWGDTAVTLPDGRWTNAFTRETRSGGAVPLAELLSPYPVALLTN
jgi:(1->4)-alpha-D-glucan 1-alpha-D-glucosylmutase